MSSNSDGINLFRVVSEKLEDFDLKANELEADFLEALGKCYLKILEKEYEYRYSDEAIIETIEANDYCFLENGKMI